MTYFRIFSRIWAHFLKMKSEDNVNSDKSHQHFSFIWLVTSALLRLTPLCFIYNLILLSFLLKSHKKSWVFLGLPWCCASALAILRWMTGVQGDWLTSQRSHSSYWNLGLESENLLTLNFLSPYVAPQPRSPKPLLLCFSLICFQFDSQALDRNLGGWRKVAFSSRYI